MNVESYAWTRLRHTASLMFFTFDPLTGVKALDINGEDITSKVKVVSNNVDTKKAGTYKVVYSAIDRDGNTITAERTVVVTEKVVGPEKDPDINQGKDPIPVIIDENGNKVLFFPN